MEVHAKKAWDLEPDMLGSKRVIRAIKEAMKKIVGLAVRRRVDNCTAPAGLVPEQTLPVVECTFLSLIISLQYYLNSPGMHLFNKELESGVGVCTANTRRHT